MAEEVDYEVIIVGAGIMGSATAYYLAKQLGKKVLLLEQFDFLHRKGSSHGDSRITRYTYAQDYYTELMFDAFKLWNEAEKESETKVFTQTGGLDFGHKDNPSILNLIEGAKKFKVEHEVFHDAKKLAEKFPMLKLQPDYLAVYTPSAGILNASKAVSMFQNLARSNGCKLIDNSPVTNIKAEGQKVVIETENGLKFHANKCILTCGPWAKKMLKSIANVDAPLNPIQPTVAYWKVEKPETYSSKTFPVFINYDEPLLYGFPVHEFPNLLKCCAHVGPNCDPDKRTFDPGFDDINNGVSPWLQKVFTGVSKTPQMTESCMYTETPDYDFIIDQVPSFPGGNVLIGCGFSGHGFKLSPVVGQLLAAWSITGKFPLSSKIQSIFSLKRFDSTIIKSTE